MASAKSCHALVLDSGPIIRNEPSVDTILAKSENVLTIPEVILEIQDPDAKHRVETHLTPFLTLRSPRQTSVEFVSSFAKKTGDFSLLSRTDLLLLALTYEVECEHNGSSHLRNAPGQKLRKKSPTRQAKEEHSEVHPNINAVASERTALDDAPKKGAPRITGNTSPQPEHTLGEHLDVVNGVENLHIELNDKVERTPIDVGQSEMEPTNDTLGSSAALDPESDDAEGWITPSNLRKHLDQDMYGSVSPVTDSSTPQIACVTTDFAMQNVLLQIGLNLLSPTFQKIKNVKTFILRCHACFQQVRDTSKQFCPRCGNATLTRVSCSTDYKGVFRIHLKKNMEWHHRGNRYSIPKPVHGSASGKSAHSKGGGKGGWGQQLILAEDQKEYQRAAKDNASKAKDLMDEDYLPGILSGKRDKSGGRPRVGAGRNVNARRRQD